MDMERIDVVCQQPVEESIARTSGLTLEHQGHMFYFCSSKCMEQFRHDPQMYAGRLDREYGHSSREGISYHE